MDEARTPAVSHPSRDTRLRRALRVLRDNPVTTATFVIGVILGAVAAVQLELGPEGMSMTKQVLGGALMGAWLAMFPLGFRLFE